MLAPKTRVVLADDHTLLREALRAALSLRADLEIVGEAANGLQAQEVAVDQHADVLLMDIEMPIVNGIEATRQLGATHPEIGVIVVSEHTDEGHIFQSLRAGARGFLSKSSSLDELLGAIDAVADGKTVLDPAATHDVVCEFRRLSKGTTPDDGLGALTGPELKLLALMGSGMSNKEIAGCVNLAESTVKNRASVLFEKIGVLDRTQAAIYGIRHGVVPEQGPTRRLKLAA